jgi:RHS repeat-associated protein
VRTAGAASGAPVDPFAFTGQYLDSPTGLYHLRARQYDPTIGRFTAVDPVAQSITSPCVNAYTYGRDNPLRFVDPSGKIVWCLAGAGIGAGSYVLVNLVFNLFGGQNPTSGLTIGGLAASAGMGCVTAGISAVIGGSLTTIGATTGERVLVQGTLVGITGVAGGAAEPAINGSRDATTYASGILSSLAGAAPIVPSGSETIDAILEAGQSRAAKDALTGSGILGGAGSLGDSGK